MKRRAFIFKSTGLVLTAWLPSFSVSSVFQNKMSRIGMATVLFRYRFRQTRPDQTGTIENELTLPGVPAYFRDRFGVKNLDYWSYHFESLEKPYLEEVKKSILAADARLANIQLDGPYIYNLASDDEERRLKDVAHVKQWIDAASFLDSEAIRVNPGRNGSVENSIRSLKEINSYAKEKDVIILTENHFGIEMNPQVHLRINREAGPENIYTLPDFGNYPYDSMFELLKEIIPHAHMISAKAAEFNENYEHVSFEFDKCVRLAERLGFKGVYSVEQWSRWKPSHKNIDFERVGDWLIKHVQQNI